MSLETKHKNKVEPPLCQNGCACQSAGGKPLCTISEAVNGKILFTECKQTPGCSFQHSFGSTFMCLCPVRLEIYRKSGI